MSPLIVLIVLGAAHTIGIFKENLPGPGVIVLDGVYQFCAIFRLFNFFFEIPKVDTVLLFA